MNLLLTPSNIKNQLLPRDWVMHTLQNKPGEYELVPVVKTHTRAQENSVFRYCRLVAQALNEKGVERYGAINGEPMKTHWTMENVRGSIWCEFQYALFETVSVKDLSTTQVDQVFTRMYDYLSSEERGDDRIEVEFPNRKII